MKLCRALTLIVLLEEMGRSPLDILRFPSLTSMLSFRGENKKPRGEAEDLFTRQMSVVEYGM